MTTAICQIVTFLLLAAFGAVTYLVMWCGTGFTGWCP